jgi:hypothetical protein
LFDRLIHLSQRALDIWQRAPAIAAPKAFGSDAGNAAFCFLAMTMRGKKNRSKRHRRLPAA